MLRCWVAGFLRIGIGLSLMGSGLVGYFSRKGSVTRPLIFNLGDFSEILEPYFAALPYLAIALGLALIVGFLTSAAAIGSAFFSLFMMVLAMFVSYNAARGNGQFGVATDPFLSMILQSNLPQLIPYAALIWFSSVENHPVSIDALIFGRTELVPDEPAQTELPGSSTHSSG
jgi:uncharacterized membrane protein YphA (DoxX/SURF4 family)